MSTCFGSPQRIGLGASLVLGALLAALMALAVTPRAEAVSDSITATGTITDTLTLDITQTSVDFGANLTPSGDGAGGAAFEQPGTGAYYVQNSAATVQVDSSKAWSGNVSATENSGTSYTGTTDPAKQVDVGHMHWMLGGMGGYSDASTAPAFTTGADSSVFNQASNCSVGSVSSPTASNASCTFDYSYSLGVLWDNISGSFSSTVTYDAVQAA